jgi:hypothetical protein
MECRRTPGSLRQQVRVGEDRSTQPLPEAASESLIAPPPPAGAHMNIEYGVEQNLR